MKKLLVVFVCCFSALGAVAQTPEKVTITPDLSPRSSPVTITPDPSSRFNPCDLDNLALDGYVAYDMLDKMYATPVVKINEGFFRWADKTFRDLQTCPSTDLASRVTVPVLLVELGQVRAVVRELWREKRDKNLIVQQNFQTLLDALGQFEPRPFSPLTSFDCTTVRVGDLARMNCSTPIK